MLKQTKFSVVLVVAAVLTGVKALDCNGQADIVIAVPGSKQIVPQGEFILLEDFLINLINYYTISPVHTNVGLVLYGSEPHVINRLTTDQEKRDVNTKVSMLAQRELYYDMDTGLNVVKAMDAIIDLHASSTRPAAAKIGIIMTFGGEDLSADNEQDLRNVFTAAGQRAAAAGIHMFAVSSNGGSPGFEFLGKDRCSLFSLGSYTGLGSLLEYLASATCYVTDTTVTPIPGNCFPEIKPKVPISTMTCPPPTSGYYADKNNCAYFIRCTQNGRIRQRCAGGTLYDMNIERCNLAPVSKCYEK
ncbi:hypothetical protein LOTGIDRAFT_238400 [Lottia gigantea]|uniref:Chitin-binding type-2 domain-containing protein n=1 Tax=Lottia gigantea TaxID=225164 RepID=V4CG11_LOTGI|nr:hypothetical protein LOTGIDRAFT_238400 [Lottia gigantea]ESP00990.1 hypothetical protein LOTGIDRAFT_238400 [Lottia gigantea]